MPPEIACRVIADAAEGLHAAHELLGKNGEKLGLVFTRIDDTECIAQVDLEPAHPADALHVGKLRLPLPQGDFGG